MWPWNFRPVWQKDQNYKSESFGSNSYVCRSYRRKIGRRVFCTPPPPAVLNRVNVRDFRYCEIVLKWFETTLKVQSYKLKKTSIKWLRRCLECIFKFHISSIYNFCNYTPVKFIILVKSSLLFNNNLKNKKALNKEALKSRSHQLFTTKQK